VCARCQFEIRLIAPLPLSCSLPPRLAIYPVGHCHYDRRDETTNREQNTNAEIDSAFNPLDHTERKKRKNMCY
jgi:hypothetical protein